MDYVSESIRDEFVKICEIKPLIQLAEILRALISEGMIIGYLDLAYCRNSVYFFC